MDLNLRQLMVGDYVALPCFNSVVDRGMVVAVHGTIVEYMIGSPGHRHSGISWCWVMRRPDPQTGYFGRYGYVGVKNYCAQRRAANTFFAKQLLAACQEVRAQPAL